MIEDMIVEDVIALPEHKLFDLAKWIDESFVKYKKIFDKMYPTYCKKLWKFLLEKFIVLFIQYVLTSSLKYAPEDLERLQHKLDEEREITHDVFSSVLTEKDVDDRIGPLDLLIKSFKKPVDELVVLVVNLRIALKQKNFNT